MYMLMVSYVLLSQTEIFNVIVYMHVYIFAYAYSLSKCKNDVANVL